MRKSLLFILVFVAFAASASAQFILKPAPWKGNKNYIFNAGMNFTLVQPTMSSDVHNPSYSPGLALSYRFEGDKNINNKLSWGFQFEFSFMSQGYQFYKKDKSNGNNRYYDVGLWIFDGAFRYGLGYWINDNIELQISAGVFLGFFHGNSGESYGVTATGAEIADSRKNEVAISIISGLGISTMLQAKYFFNDNLFLSLNVHDNIGLGSMELVGNSGKNGQRGIVLLGIGYKVLR